MAWNQPSGQNNNPWGRRPGQPGADLEERLKSLQRRLGSLLGPAGGGREGSTIFVYVVVALAVAWWLASGAYTVGQAQRAVIQRYGRLIEVRPPGLGWHLPWPIETATKVNVASVDSNKFKSRVLTSDGNLVDLYFAVQYQYSDPVKTLFSVREPGQTLSEVSESAIREVVGRSTLADVLVSARPEIKGRTMELIQRTLDYYNSGITITSVNLQDVQVPDAVIPSQRDANKAKADSQRSILEAEAYANGIIPVAQGGAARVLQDAEAYKAKVTAVAEGQAARFTQLEGAYAAAPEVTRRRLYMDTIEGVLARAHKVLIDGHAGNSVLYLPIEKLLEKMTAREAESPPADNTAAATPGKEPDQVTVEARARGER
ncbi:MAG TPA: FtsH protease activity modulator HflK [Steroidobacteraceae bacterium]|jgi:membrane protease subunit HflK|nr:FtsH protease activity modulator HflK [Steroidobacteraceae bacterium]